MPLRQMKYGGECPLGKFKIDIPAGGGVYTNDPVEACLNCNFNKRSKKFNPQKTCQCPIDMTWPKYDELRKEYSALCKKSKFKPTKPNFWKFVNENFKK